MVETYGPVYKTRAFGGWNVALIGADANELVLFDRDKIFSSEQGWGPILDQLFPRGLMLMDFAHHRIDRSALRSEERRVGQEWFSTCRSRWSPYHEKNKTPNKIS